MSEIANATLEFPGRPADEVDHYQPLLVWDDYHGFVVGRRNPLSNQWQLDLPYGFETGGKEIELEQVKLWWPLPSYAMRQDR